MREKITRREMLAASAAAAGIAALTSCTKEAPLIQSRVSVVRAPAYDQSLYDTVRRLLD